MQKIVIKNFGPITDAEIELKKTVVLIGEQATGKSTIAKLIYYFKSLRDDLFNKIYKQSLETESFRFEDNEYLNYPAREKFYDLFGSTHHMQDFRIVFYYDIEKDKYLELTLNDNKNLYTKFSRHFKSNTLGVQIQKTRHLLPENVNEAIPSEVLAYNQEKLNYAERLSNLLKETFCCEQDDDLFIIAGRNATVGYSESFENQFLINARLQYEESYKKKQQTIDETLMLAFMDRVVDMKGMFKKFGDFESYLDVFDTKKKSYIRSIIDKIYEILKGRYQIDTYGEKIAFGDEMEEYVHLSNASSGQQEVIRILQDIFLSITRNRNVFRIVEEPEAHLFPIAQKKVIELLVQMVNNNDNNQLIITTHSPYVLTVLNNLLFAQRVIDKNNTVEEDISKIVSKESRMKSCDFTAYVLKNEDGNVYSKSIVDESTGMITQNYLDTVSEMLSNEFNALYEIHAKTFSRP